MRAEDPGLNLETMGSSEPSLRRPVAGSCPFAPRVRPAPHSGGPALTQADSPGHTASSSQTTLRTASPHRQASRSSMAAPERVTRRSAAGQAAGRGFWGPGSRGARGSDCSYGISPEMYLCLKIHLSRNLASGFVHLSSCFFDFHSINLSLFSLLPHIVLECTFFNF